MKADVRQRSLRIFIIAAVALALAGCTTTRAPYVVMFNSYFPSWIICATAGCIAALLTRVVFVHLDLDEYLPLRVVTYFAVAAAVTFLLSLILFAR